MKAKVRREQAEKQDQDKEEQNQAAQDQESPALVDEEPLSNRIKADREPDNITESN